MIKVKKKLFKTRMASYSSLSFMSPSLNFDSSLLSISERNIFKRFLPLRHNQGLVDSAELFGKVQILRTISNSDVCLSVAFSPDGKYYAVALANGLINVYNSRNDNRIYILNKPKDPNIHCTNISCTCVRFRPFPNQNNEEVKNINNNDNRRRKSLKSIRSYGQGSETQSRNSSEINPNVSDHFPPIPIPFNNRRKSLGSWSMRESSIDLLLEKDESNKSKPNYFLSATFTDGTVKSYRLFTEECLHIVEEGERDTLTLDYSPDGRVFMTAGGDGILNVYDTETHHKISSFQPKVEKNRRYRPVCSLAFHPKNHSEVLAGGWDRQVWFYDLRMPESHKCLWGQFLCGEGIAFHPEGNEFCTASWQPKNTLQIFDYKTLKRLKTFDNHRDPKSLSSSLLYTAKYYPNDGRYIMIGGTKPNSLTLIEWASEKTHAGLKNLGKSVYSLDVSGSKGVMVTGNEVALMDFFL